MNKKISVLVVSVMSLSLLAACSTPAATTTAAGTTAGTTAAATTVAGTTAAGTTAAGTTAAGTTTATTQAPKTIVGPVAGKAGSIVKMGLGIISSVAKSTDFTAEKPGAAQADVIAAAVGFDKDGKVVAITIDNGQTKVEFNADGTLKSDVAATYMTKQEKKEAYGMIKASKIGYEWYQQAESLSAWMQGKTVAEIKSMKTKAGADAAHPAVPDEADLVSSVSITVQDYIAVVEKAWTNAVEVKEGADKVGLGFNISIASSKAKTADKPASAQIDNTISAIALKGDKVAATVLDIVQAKVAYDADGKVTTDKTAEVKSKVELGDEYGMKKTSKIGKEWFEQAKALTDWTVGKTAAEIKGIPSEDKDGKKIVTGDLATSVSVGVADYLASFDEAIMMAR